MHRSYHVKNSNKGTEREIDCKDRGLRAGKEIKMTLLGITTAALNVLHYKICDKTFLCGGL